MSSNAELDRASPSRFGASESKREVDDAQLSHLAASIHDAVRNGSENLLKSLDFYIEAGRDLVKAKAALGHGRFGAWCERNIKLCAQHCRFYMRLYENRALFETIKLSQDGEPISLNAARRLMQLADDPSKAPRTEPPRRLSDQKVIRQLIELQRVVFRKPFVGRTSTNIRGAVKSWEKGEEEKAVKALLDVCTRRCWDLPALLKEAGVDTETAVSICLRAADRMARRL